MSDNRLFISTERVPPSGRLDYWQHEVGELLTHLECQAAAGDPFFGALTVHPSTPISLFEIQAAAHTIARATPKIAVVGEEQVFICIQTAGSATIEQDSRQNVLNPGGISLLDTSKAFHAEFPAEMKQLVFQAPRSLVRKHIGVVERFTATVVSSDNPLGAVCTDFAKALAREFDRLTPEAAQRLSAQAMDMFAMAFMSLPDPGQHNKSSITRSMLAYRGRTFIEANLRNSSLSPTDVAQHLGISRRYLSSVFASDGLSFERFVRERRLQKCATDLRDQGQAIRPIGDIAYAWGFNNLTHFSQAFKAAFGTTPREFRKQALYPLQALVAAN